jgi:hypothetical protein
MEVSFIFVKIAWCKILALSRLQQNNMTAISKQIFNDQRHCRHDEIKAITAEVVFGAASSKCTGQGICRVYVVAEAASYTLQACSCTHSALGQFIHDPKKRLLVLSFQKSAIADATREHCFNTGLFHVDEAWIAHGEICQALNMKSLTIAPGDYPIVPKGERVEIWFCSSF